MLIHIESYIRQLLLPTFRQPRYIGLARVLFESIQFVLNKHNDFEREAIFRAGLTGQKLLLEYYLQTTVEGSIYLEDRDGVRLDFVVIVPQGLSAANRKKVYDIVSAYKLASKRFELQNVFFTSAPPEQTNLAWANGYPAIDSTDKIALAVTITGTYRTRIRAQGQSSYLKDEMVSYLANQAQVTTVTTGYVYDIEVEALTATLDFTAPPQRICDLTFDFGRPDGWIQVVKVNGIRQIKAYLYSAYANLAPFVLRLYDYNNITGAVGGLAYEKTGVQNPQPLTVDLPNTFAPAGGVYAIRFLDKDGCATPIGAVVVPAADNVGSACTIAFDDSAGANTAVVVTVVGQQYQVSVKVALAQTNAKTVTVKKASDDTLISSSGFSGDTYMYFLPIGTTQQSIKVEITEGVNCTTGIRTISLPALSGSGLVASHSRTDLINIVKGSDGKWADTESDEMGTKKAWYFTGADVPYKDANGNRKKFAGEEFQSGLVLWVRKIYLEESFFNSWDRVENQMWQGGPGLHPEWIGYNCQQKITT